MDIENICSDFFDSNIYKANERNFKELLPYESIKDQQGWIYPIVDLKTCDHVFNNIGILQSIIGALVEDSFSGFITTNNETLRKYWKTNQPELLSALTCYLKFGFAVILFDSKDTFVTLDPLKLQFKESSVYLFNNNTEYSIIKKSNESFLNKVMFITKVNEKSNYFSFPAYYSLLTELLDFINDKKNNMKSSANNGNPRGLIIIDTPPKKRDERDIGDAIKDGLKNSGSGLLFIKKTLNYNYDKSGGVNYIEFKQRDYLASKDLNERIQSLILGLYRVPATRIGVYTTATTRNSSTNVSVYSVYQKDLLTFQKIIYRYIEFINELIFDIKVVVKDDDSFDYDSQVEFSIPEFSDNELITSQMVYNLVNTNVISADEARLILNKYFEPNLNLKDTPAPAQPEQQDTGNGVLGGLKKTLSRNTPNNQANIQKAGNKYGAPKNYNGEKLKQENI